MQPLSRTTRRLYFYSSLVIFFVAVPLLILYALGYRLDDKYAIVPTGGIYIATDISGAEIFLNDVPEHETGTFRKAFFIQDIDPREVTVRVTKPEYHDWQKHLDVEAHVVTEATAFMLPIKPPFLEVSPYIGVVTTIGTTTASTTHFNDTYAGVAALFDLIATSTGSTTVALNPKPLATTTKKINGRLFTVATTTVATTTVEMRGVSLHATGTTLFATWMRTDEIAPYFFCDKNRECLSTIPIETYGLAFKHFDFYPGRYDIALVARDDGIYATEVDPRGGQNSQPLYAIGGADFRIGARGEVYVRSGDQFFEYTPL